MDFSKRLKELRKLQGMSKGHIAKALRVTPGNVKEWEKKGVQPPLEVFCRLAKLLDVSTDCLKGNAPIPEVLILKKQGRVPASSEPTEPPAQV